MTIAGHDIAAQQDVLAQRQAYSRGISTLLTEAQARLGSVLTMLDWIEHSEEKLPMTIQERQAVLKGAWLSDVLQGIALAYGEISRRTVSPMRRRPASGRRGGRSKWTIADQIDSELEKHLVNGLIRNWSRCQAFNQNQGWIVRMSNGQTVSFSSAHQAMLFCDGLESAHQAHREQDHNIDGQQWAYERGRAGMGPDEFRRQRGIRDRHGPEKLRAVLIEEGSRS